MYIGGAIVKEFWLKEEHIKLLRAAYVQWNNCETGAPEIDPKRPYGIRGGRPFRRGVARPGTRRHPPNLPRASAQTFGQPFHPHGAPGAFRSPSARNRGL